VHIEGSLSETVQRYTIHGLLLDYIGGATATYR